MINCQLAEICFFRMPHATGVRGLPTFSPCKHITTDPFHLDRIPIPSSTPNPNPYPNANPVVFKSLVINFHTSEWWELENNGST